MPLDLARQLEFPQPAMEVLQPALNTLCTLPQGEGRLQAGGTYMVTGEGTPFKELSVALSAESGVPVQTVELLMQLYAALALKPVYRAKGYSQELYWETLDDLSCKMQECYQVYGIWGTVAADWQQGFFRCKMFKLGRLQYEIFHLPVDYKNYKAGDPAYNLHIPSGGSMSPAAVLESLRRAYAFFRPQLANGILPVHLHSWLIYPGHYNVYPEGSNLRHFYDLFDVFEPVEKPKNPYLWRVFGVEKCDDYTTLPEHTSLQRRFKEYLVAGRCMGAARGMLLFDGEKIIK